MKYQDTFEGIFICRPNRFIAHVELDGEIKVCHVKNTGRCKELLVEGRRVILEKSGNPLRKTEYDLVSVYKGDKLINIDSQAPNKIFGEWLEKSDFFKNVGLIRPETAYKNSRFDYYIEADGRKIFAEIKGATLENNGVVMFPDAPTERGVKHIEELCDAVSNGFDAYVFFIIQMKDCKYFKPNETTHPKFAKALLSAREKGVKIYALNCDVGESSIEACDFVKVCLDIIDN